MIEVTQADRDCRNAIYKELTCFAVIEPMASQADWMDKYLAAHRIAAEKAVMDRLDTIPMNPVIDIAFEKWRVLLTGDMVRGIVRAALEAKP